MEQMEIKRCTIPIKKNSRARQITYNYDFKLTTPCALQKTGFIFFK